MNDKILEFNHDLTVGELIEALKQFPQNAVVDMVGETQTWKVRGIEFNADNNTIYLSE